ncbi:MAG: alpha-galactosidase [Thermoguttaceae bacterium]|nr:alpha-galactosidase [Thermoguttaceae bacterium]
MKRLVVIAVALVVCAALFSFPGAPNASALEPANVGSYSGAPTEEELAFMRRWSGFLLEKGDAQADRYSAEAPFSFVCGDRSSREWVTVERASVTLGEWTENGERTSVATWKDDVSTLVCTATFVEYRDYPALQWTVRITNDGNENSAPIHDFKALDLQWNRSDTTLPILYRSQGSDGRNDDFLFAVEDMRKSMWVHNRDLRMDSATNSAFRTGLGSSLFDSDMRPSATWLPFFNYRTGPDGLIVALGWNGGWFAEFNHDGDGRTRMTAGQEKLNTILYPNETIRSPLVGLLYWKGEVGHAQNVFRRYMLAHNHPQENGKPAPTPICRISWGGSPTDEHLKGIREIVDGKFDYDCYWIDAGWYGQGKDPCPDVFHGDWGSTVGDWRVNPTRHPDALKPIADALVAAKMKFLLWFETERAVCGVPATLEHPEWYLTASGAAPNPGESLLLNLGDPNAREWVTKTIGDILEENKISWYREDFNMVPNPYWEAHDAPDRVGMTEMRFVEGLYQFWDDLRARIPGLMIDNCASGGRRLELETLKRSIVLWRTDYNCFPYLRTEATQSHGFGISHWIPANATSPYVTEPDTYQCRSALSSGAVLALNNDHAGETDPSAVEWLKARVAEANRCRPYFYGDFYPLTEGNWSDDAWLAYSMHLPQEDAGIVVAFRRPKAFVSTLVVELQALDPNRKYEFEDADSGEKRVVDGKELRENGFAIKAEQPRTSRLFYYRAVE